MNFNLSVVINSDQLDWVASPTPGVWRKPLAREDAERGHATSIVRFEAGASFPEHGHPLGEEILVLDGVFSDATGDYCAGTYFRNPEGFRHSPFSERGCVLLVKLHQFQDGDDAHVIVNTQAADWQAGQGNLKVLPLHEHGSESVSLVRWPRGEKFHRHVHMGGEEIFVITGELMDENGRYPAGTWIRKPHMSQHTPYVEEDTLLWVKVGHLPLT